MQSPLRPISVCFLAEKHFKAWFYQLKLRQSRTQIKKFQDFIIQFVLYWPSIGWAWGLSLSEICISTETLLKINYFFWKKLSMESKFLEVFFLGAFVSFLSRNWFTPVQALWMLPQPLCSDLYVLPILLLGSFFFIFCVFV